MDSTIQALVQSPFMRAMSVIPTKSEELVHGIHDHLPPVKKTYINVMPDVQGGQTGRWIFSIPRRGLLHSLKLIIRATSSSGGGLSPSRMGGDNGQYNPYLHTGAFVETMEYVELYSKQKFIERIYPECMMHANVQYGQKEHQNYLYDARQVNIAADATFANVDAATPFPFLVKPYPVAFDVGTGIRPHFIIPIPLSSFSSIKKNLQTFFIEPLTFVVKAKQFPYFGSELVSYQMMIECGYHEFHPNVETALRNANYKPSVPATLPWSDWIQFERRLAMDGTKRVYALDSDALISEIVVVPCLRTWQNDLTVQPLVRLYSGATTVKLSQNYYVVIQGNGEILLEGSVERLTNESYLQLNEDYRAPSADLYLDESSWYFSFKLGITSYEERFSGGLALSSLSNASISIYLNEAAYNNANVNLGTSSYFNAVEDASTNQFEFKVFAKRHFLLRIDSDTGVLTRSIES